MTAPTTDSPKPLKTRFKLGNYNYELVKRAGDIAIFEQVHKKNPAIKAWEVIRIKHRPAATFNGVHFPACESYPSPEEWGIRGWTYTKIEYAEAKFIDLVAGEPSSRQLGSCCRHSGECLGRETLATSPAAD